MKRFIQILILLAIVPYAKGQEVFNKIHPTTETRTELLTLDSGYVVMHQGQMDSKRLVIREFDHQGNKIDSVSYLFDEMVDNLGAGLCQINGKQEFVFCQTRYGYRIPTQAHLIRFDRDWDTLSSRLYMFNDSLDVSAKSLVADSDSTFLLTGSAFDTINYKTSLFLSRFDTDFNLLWETKLDDPVDVVGGHWGFHILPTANAIYVGAGRFYPGGQLPHAGSINKFDIHGNLLWHELIISSGGNGALSLGTRSDGNFFFMTNERLDSNIMGLITPESMRFGIFDGDGNILENKSRAPFEEVFWASNLVQMSDHSFVITGGYAGDSGLNSHISKMDENGNILWRRIHYHVFPDATSVLENIKATPDGGFVASGEFSDSQDRLATGKQTWLLKVDEFGCENVCHTIGEAETVLIKNEIASIYPNPAQDQLFVDWQQIDPNTQIAVELINAKGVVVLKEHLSAYSGEQSVFQLGGLASGLYVIRFSSSAYGIQNRKLMID
jgi:hypothetical protein